MVDSMETSYSMHGHTRSLSSIASTILPIASDASTYTSVTASPMEPQDLDTLPIELKVPLPTSSCCSMEDLQALKEDLDLSRNSQPAGDRESRDELKRYGHQMPIFSTLQNETKEDVGQFEGPSASNVSLDELARLVDAERFQKRRAISATLQFDRQSIICGLNHRLSSTMMIAYGNLIDQYKGDDQAGFAGLYEALEKVKNMCSREDLATRVDNVPSDNALLGEITDHRPWTQQLPAEDRKCMVDFLTRLRTDPDFLANRIASLEPPELAALTSSYHPAGVDLSVLANHSHGMTQFYSHDSQMMKLSRRMDNLQHFHDQDPFFTLIYCLFDNTASASSLEYARRNDIWSSTCAKIITDRRPGGDELIIAAADAFMSLEDWKLKPRIELYLQTTLAKGSFLLDPLTNVPSSAHESLESKNASHAVRVANFFESALDDLFQLIASVPHMEALPKTAQDFVQSTIRKIQDSQMQLRAKHFLISRWYFASFLSSVIVYPELQGLLMTHHIGDSARQHILKQIVIRMQAQVFDVLLSRADDMLVSLERRVQILAISNYFEPNAHDSTPKPLQESHTRYFGDTQARQLMLSPQDLSGLVHTLYPNNPVPEKLVESLVVSQASAPPSTTSSSTLRPGSSDLGSRASSMGPNYSGSSMNSEATITAYPQASPQGIVDSLSQGLSRNRTATAGMNCDADPSQVAWQLWTLHAKLQGISRNGLDPASGAERTNRWAIFSIHSSGRVSLKPSVPSPDLFVPDDGAYQTDRKASKLGTLKKAIVSLLADQDRGQLEKPYYTQSPSSVQDPLRVLLEDALARSRLSMRFGVAHYWHSCLDIYSDFATSSDGRNAVQDLQNSLGKDLQSSVDDCIKRAQASENLIRSLSFLLKQQKASLAILESRRKALRIKMWYLSDVRHSSTYEEALLVTKALRAMSAPKRNRQPGSTFSWARQRLRGALSQERADAQTLEAMTASKDCGGRSKLADDQVEMTSRWLTRNGIENFCTGEERIHRFCYEVQKSVGKLAGASLLESPVLWSSHLFKREKAAFDTRSPRAGVAPSSGSYTPPNFSYGGNWRSLGSAQYSLPPMTSPVSVGAYTVGLGNPRGFTSDGRSTSASSSVLPAPSSGLSSMQYRHTMDGNITMPRPGPRYEDEDVIEGTSLKKKAIAKDTFLKSMRDALYGLLASDLGYLLWDQGSETDAWINRAAAEEQADEKAALNTVRSSLEVQTGELQQKDIAEYSTGFAGQTLKSQEQSRSDPRTHESHFNFADAYRTLLHRMSTTHDPSIKLEMFSQLENLVVLSVHDTLDSDNGSGASGQNQTTELHSETMARSKSVPRTKTTSLEEVVANCTERRAATLRATPNLSDLVSTDAIVNHLLAIFRDPQLRPINLFLSLQYIAALIPSHTLDHTAHGKAFWDCSLAALALKEDLCNQTVRRAAEITNAYITSKPTSPPYPSQQEAANLWLVAAKEGSPVAARELSLFYLTHPDLLSQRVTMPLSRTRDVFKSVRPGEGSSTGEKERGTLDPLTFDVVHHWMEIAANGGDEVARTFLRQGGGQG